jgi:hypothetical protein
MLHVKGNVIRVEFSYKLVTRKQHIMVVLEIDN